MKLTEQIKAAIKTEYENWFNEQYGDKSLEERRELGAFFTPPELTIRMIEKFETLENKTILDPTCGTGNLLAACIIAGADPTKVYGNEYDDTFLILCRNRLKKFGVPDYHIHKGDVLDTFQNNLNVSCISKKSFRSDYKYQQQVKEELW